MTDRLGRRYWPISKEARRLVVGAPDRSGAGRLLDGMEFFNLLTNWSMYLSPVAERFLPVSGHTLMLNSCPIEILVGLSILTSWTRLGAYVLSVWLLAISINMVSTGGFYNLAVRDVEIAIVAYVLANLPRSGNRLGAHQIPEPDSLRESARPVAAA